MLPFPSWSEKRTQPIDERDAVEYLARTPLTPGAEGRSLDIAGADLLSYGRMIERIAELMGVGRTPLRLGASATPMASAVVSALVDQPLELVRPLMYSLEHDLLPRERRGARKSTGCGRGRSTAPSSTRLPSGSRSSPWRRDEGRAQHRDRRARRARLRRGDGSAASGGLGYDPRRAQVPPQGRTRARIRARSVPEARGTPLRRPLGRRRGGPPHAGGLARKRTRAFAGESCVRHRPADHNQDSLLLRERVQPSGWTTGPHRRQRTARHRRARVRDRRSSA